MPRTHIERIPLGGSSGLERRGLALCEYLGELHATLESGLDFKFAPVRLLVLNSTDWASANKYPYGFTFFSPLARWYWNYFCPRRLSTKTALGFSGGADQHCTQTQLEFGDVF